MTANSLLRKLSPNWEPGGLRTLSYAGRAQLINTVLLKLHTYWASIFVLPKKVIDGVIAACRNYLWDGKASSSKTPLIAWDLICRDKKEGGLGFKESHAWNEALLGKYIWSVATKADNLWVKWVNHVYLKGKDWKNYTPSSNVSWYWRQLTHIKDTFRGGYNRDRWTFDSKGNSATSGYKWIRKTRENVPWASWVWNRTNIPKHSFLCWIIMWGRLNTRDRLSKMGIQCDTICPMCERQDESIEHLFRECIYIKWCYEILTGKLDLTIPQGSMQQLSSWLHKPTTGSFRNKVIKTIVVGLLYQV